MKQKIIIVAHIILCVIQSALLWFFSIFISDNFINTFNPHGGGALVARVVFILVILISAIPKKHIHIIIKIWNYILLFLASALFLYSLRLL